VVGGFKTLADHAAIALTTCRAWYTLAWNARGEEGRSEVEGALAAVTVAGPERCRLLTLAGLVRGYSGLRGGDERIAEAEVMAEEIGDAQLVADVDHHRTWYNHHFMLLRAGLETGRRAEAYHKTVGAHFELADVRGSMDFMRTYRGEFVDMTRDAPEFLAQAGRIGHLASSCGARLWPAWISVLASGDLSEAAADLQHEVDLERRISYGLRGFSLLARATTLEWGGEREALLLYREAAATEGQNMVTHTFASALLLARVLFGEQDAAAEIMATAPLARAGTANLIGEWEQLANIVEGRAVLGESAAVAPLYPLVVQ